MTMNETQLISYLNQKISDGEFPCSHRLDGKED